jgi:hypothetical protein
MSRTIARIADKTMDSKVVSRKAPITRDAMMPGVTIPEEPMTIARGEMIADQMFPKRVNASRCRQTP